MYCRGLGDDGVFAHSVEPWRVYRDGCGFIGRSMGGVSIGDSWRHTGVGDNVLVFK